MDVPYEVLENPGRVYVTFIGVKNDGTVLETARMKKPIIVKTAGIDDGAEPAEPTAEELINVLGNAVAELSEIVSNNVTDNDLTMNAIADLSEVVSDIAVRLDVLEG